MKNLMTSLIVLSFVFVQSVNAQRSNATTNAKLNHLKVTVEVDSAEDLEKKLDIEDIQDALAMVAEDQLITLKITCLKQPNKNGVKPSISYEITGNANKPEEFIELTKHIKKSALKIYRKG